MGNGKKTRNVFVIKDADGNNKLSPLSRTF